MTVSKRWPAPAQQYWQRYQLKEDFELAKFQFIQVEPDTWVANMVGQHKLNIDEKGNPLIRHGAVLSRYDKSRRFAVR